MGWFEGIKDIIWPNQHPAEPTITGGYWGFTTPPSAPFLGWTGSCSYWIPAFAKPSSVLQRFALDVCPVLWDLWGLWAEKCQECVKPNNNTRTAWWFGTWIFFSIMYGIILPIDSYFSRWLKPLTRCYWWLLLIFLGVSYVIWVPPNHPF